MKAIRVAAEMRAGGAFSYAALAGRLMLFRSHELHRAAGLVPLDPILEHDGFIVLDVARGE